MRESRTYGFVRGARGNSRPYRVPHIRACHLLHLLTTGYGGKADLMPVPSFSLQMTRLGHGRLIFAAMQMAVVLVPDGRPHRNRVG
jgi:hypothetical protein